MPRARYHRFNETPSREDLQRGAQLAAGITLGPAAIALRAGADVIAAKLLAAFGALALLALPLLINGSLLRGFQVDDDGLVEARWLGRRRLSWRHLTRVHRGDDGATLVFGPQRVHVPANVTDWAALVGRAEALLAGDPPTDEDLRVPRDRVAQWLGVAADGQLDCTSGYHRLRIYTEPLLALASVALAVWLLRYHWQFPVVALAMLALWTVKLGLPRLVADTLAALLVRLRYHTVAERRVDRVLATPDHLDAHCDSGWHRYAWGNLRAIEQRGAFTVVSTVDGDLWLPPDLTHAERLLDAIGSAIGAESRGLVLPRAGEEVPESAISLVRAERADGDRGLSRAEG